MKINYKLLIKYICFSTLNLFLTHKIKNERSLNICIQNCNLFFIAVHFKLSSLLYTSQLIELFVYESPELSVQAPKNIQKTFSQVSSNTIVYQFHNIFNNKRFFVFVFGDNGNNIKKKTLNKNTGLTSIAEIFLNANWLEREASELHSIFFYFKKDIRNLMLPYGDTSAPMKKISPSIGTREIYYEASTDLLVQSQVTLQF